jgi:hypothetical protein
MKRLFFVLTTFLIITSGYAQGNEKSEPEFYKQGNWEFGFSSNIGSISLQTTGNPGYYNEYTESGIYLNIGVSTGFYIVNGLSIEPELDINSCLEGFSVSLLGNLCYTFSLPQKNIYPYIKLGYGVSNDPENTGDLFKNLDYNTLNVGAGVKFMYFSGITFTTELNYRNLKGSTTFYPNQPYQYTTESTSYIISVLLGVSILY